MGQILIITHGVWGAGGEEDTHTFMQRIPCENEDRHWDNRSESQRKPKIENKGLKTRREARSVSSWFRKRHSASLDLEWMTFSPGHPSAVYADMLVALRYSSLKRLKHLVSFKVSSWAHIPFPLLLNLYNTPKVKMRTIQAGPKVPSAFCSYNPDISSFKEISIRSFQH